MKKKSFKSLKNLNLNKQAISNFSGTHIIGGSGSCGVCPETDSCYTTTDYTIPYSDLCATNGCQITTWCVSRGIN
ncbi:hypothetical protein H2O64_00510 [Kordia sp. YSTF-M3]|uniref:Bacteriocin n=1 Tax=Kordia aestuariivivens TaxID=2759037 RepID=A0ABR7Q3K1_9FLAO|nr:hypothetical protein [Kordia aestuariivivens]MBC8753132.1 hypothetical protein [Kordia aestuariivivens]